MTPDEQRAFDEQRVFDVLAEHAEWVATLPVNSVYWRAYGDGLAVAHLCATARMPRRAVRRALERLVAAGMVKRSRRSADTYRVAATVPR